MIKGLVLCGGLGSRLLPLTSFQNKHLLSVYDKPMVFYPIKTLTDAGIKDILIVTGGAHAGSFMKLLKYQDALNIKKLSFQYQEGEGGIADALSLAEDFANGQPICVVLGDNILEGNIKRYVDKFKHQGEGAKILIKHVENPTAYGVPVFDKDYTIIGIEEKPKEPKSQCAVIGLYMYDNKVFDYIRTLKPSNRGELEVSELNEKYIKEDKLTYDLIDFDWFDCGSPDGLLTASNAVCKWRHKENE